MNTKYLNHTLDGSDIPLSVGDRYYGQDRMRDFWHIKEYSTMLLEGLIASTSNQVISGCVVTQGAGHTLNVTLGKVLTLYQIKPPSSWASLPPTMSNVNIPIIVEVPALTNQSISGATTDGSTPNYVKIAYLETAGSSRTRSILGTAYNSEITPSYTLTCNSTPPTSYETSIATFTSNGSTITFTFGESRLILNKLNIVAKSSAYTASIYDDVILVTGNTTIILPPKAYCPGKVLNIKNMDGNTTTIDGNASETIDGALTQTITIQYSSYTIVCGSSEWSII